MDNRESIGTYAEKTVHSLLKEFFEPDRANHEVPYMGYIADIKCGDCITEIQSTQFYRLREKLKAFTSECSVNVVYPIARRKRIVWIDRNTGAVSAPRLSPKKGSVYDIFPEIAQLSPILPCKNLSFTAVLLDVTEYRRTGDSELYPHSTRFGARRGDRLPTEIVSVYMLSDRNSYTALLPESLPARFTIGELAREACVSYRVAQKTVSVFRALGNARSCGKRGRYILFELT